MRQGLIDSLAKQTSPIVQTALIDLFVGIREKRAAKALKQLINSKVLEPEVKHHAELSLQQLVKNTKNSEKKRSNGMRPLPIHRENPRRASRKSYLTHCAVHGATAFLTPPIRHRRTAGTNTRRRYADPSLRHLPAYPGELGYSTP